MLTRFDRHFPTRQRCHDRRFAKETRRLFVVVVVVLMLLLLLLLLLLDVSLEQLMTIVASCAEDLQSLVPGEMGRRFGHIFGHARQADVASASDVHLRTSVDVSL